MCTYSQPSPHQYFWFGGYFGYILAIVATFDSFFYIGYFGYFWNFSHIGLILDSVAIMATF